MADTEAPAVAPPTVSNGTEADPAKAESTGTTKQVEKWTTVVKSGKKKLEGREKTVRPKPPTTKEQ